MNQLLILVVISTSLVACSTVKTISHKDSCGVYCAENELMEAYKKKCGKDVALEKLIRDEKNETVTLDLNCEK